MPSTYIERRLCNGRDLLTWAKAQGFRHLLRLSDLHLTVALASGELATPPPAPDLGTLVIEGGGRSLVRLNHDVLALAFDAPQLEERRRALARAAFDVRGPFRPHVTFAFQLSVDHHQVTPFDDPLVFGPEQVRADVIGSRP